MKKLYFLLLLLGGFVNAQIVNIPDANFKAKLIAVGVDTNGDGNIQQNEALARTSLDVSDSSITSLTGIESFTNLTSLNCAYNHYIATLNITALTNLTYLSCNSNSLTTINVSTLTNLTHLECYSNSINALDVTPLVNLNFLGCSVNNIPVLNVGNLTHLTFLNCAYNNLTVLDVANLTNLTNLQCSSNYNLPAINVASLVNLNFLSCFSTQISSLNLASLTQLNYLSCEGTPITSLDFSTLTNLTTLICGSQLSNLNLSTNTALQSLTLQNYPLASIDLSHQTNLIGIVIFGGNLTSLDVSNSHLLTSLRLGTSQIHYLNMKNFGTMDTIALSDTSNLMNICCNESDIARVNFELSFTNTALIHTANSNCLFFPMGDYNTITGNVRFDSNNDGCDANDILQPNIKMKITNGSNIGYTYSNAAGHYEFFPQAGNFTVAPGFENSDFFTFSPTTSSVNFANNNGNITTRDFCATANGVHNDVEVVIVPTSRARPGFDSYYKIVYKNKGNQTISGDIQMIFEDDVLDYVSSSETPSSQNTGVLNWNYSNLLPFENRSFTVVMNVNSPIETPPVNIGDQLSLDVVINPLVGDEIPLDNIFGFKQTVVGSLDPNDKTCLEGTTVSPTRIGDYLHYIINFENTGTAAAENIVIKDVIDITKFDITTIQIMDSSNPVIVRMANNNIDFVFDTINLGPAQHGNVVFKVKTKNTLTTGSTVSNTANIYFDYNAPVTTNTASTTFQTLGIDEIPIDTSVVIFPNPTSNIINVNANNSIKSIQLFDVQGRILETKLEEENQVTVDVSTYSNGIYFLKINAENGSNIQRFVKK